MKRKQTGRRWIGAAAWAGASVALLALEPALAKTLGDLATGWAAYSTPLSQAAAGLCYPLGIAAGATALYKLKANRDSPQQHHVGPVFGWAAVCAGLMFLPQYARNTGDTFWGTGATANSATGVIAVGGQ